MNGWISSSSTLLRIYRSGIRLVFDFFLIFFLFRFDLQIGSIVFFISVELCSSFCSISLDVFLLRFIFFMNCIFSADVFLLMNCLLFMNCLSPLFLRMFFLRLVVLLFISLLYIFSLSLFRRKFQSPKVIFTFPELQFYTTTKGYLWESWIYGKHEHEHPLSYVVVA